MRRLVTGLGGKGFEAKRNEIEVRGKILRLSAVRDWEGTRSLVISIRL